MNAEDLLDALSLQGWTARPDGMLSHVNRYTCDYLGKERDELIEDNWQNVVHPADLATALERWTHAVTTGEPYQVDFRLLRGSDRVYRWHRATAQRVETPDGQKWIGTNVDIDAARRADEVRDAWREQLLEDSTRDDRA